MMRLRYSGEFDSRHGGHRWRVEIWQDADVAYEVGELTFPSLEPLVLTWPQLGKTETVCGSTATLRVISPDDRTYADLYTVDVCSVRLDVYLDDDLYWSGAIDTEMYEEPYERLSGYEVSITFSDFGVLDRLVYDLSVPMPTIAEVLEAAKDRCSINVYGTDTSYISTLIGEQRCTPDRLRVRSDNFYDEDGKPMSWRKVVEGVLKPMGMRLIQRYGQLWVYDLNGLCSASTVQVRWSSTRQALGVDRTYKTVRVTLSPYASSALMSDKDLKYEGERYNGLPNYTTTEVHYPGSDATYYTLDEDYSPLYPNDQGEIEHLSTQQVSMSPTQGSGLAYLHPSARYFVMEPLLGGSSEAQGVLWSMVAGRAAVGSGTLSVLNPVTKAVNPANSSMAIIMTTRRVYLPPSDGSWLLRLGLDALIDARYNPTTSADDYNDKSAYQSVNERTAWCHVPVKVELYDAEGRVLAHYDNKAVTTGHGNGTIMRRGTWQMGVASYGDAWLSYYDIEDNKDQAGIQGWQRNHHNFGRRDYYSGGVEQVMYMSDTLKRLPDGEYMPYPTEGGYLEVSVYAGILPHDWAKQEGGDNFWATNVWQNRDLYSKIRWVAYKHPTLDIVCAGLKKEEASASDVEYTGTINPLAREDLDIDTICGTMPVSMPSARALLYDESGVPVDKLTRAGETDIPERLLIATMCTHYGTRHNTLKGEADLVPEMVIYTDANMPDTTLMATAERMDTEANTNEITLTETGPDDYRAQ